MKKFLEMINPTSVRWFTFIKKTISNVSGFVIGILLVTGHSKSSLLLLIIKLSESFIMEQMDTFISFVSTNKKIEEYKNTINNKV